MNYDKLHEWGGKWYGEGKAIIESYGEELSDKDFAFISMRLAGFRELDRRKYWRNNFFIHNFYCLRDNKC